MKHSHSIDTTTHTIDAWLQRLWVSSREQDKHHLTILLEYLLSYKGNDPLEPSGLDMAETLRQLEADQITLIATLLTDPCFADLSKENITDTYGLAVATMIDSMSTLQQFTRRTHHVTDLGTEDHGEQLRRMILASVKDLRVVLIKLAWQLQLLRLLVNTSDNQALKISAAKQTQDVYAPLAARLGISQLKWEMEDLSFRFQQPETYKQIAKALAHRRIEREAYIEAFIQLIKEMLDEENIKANIYGRPKHIYSIWRKMYRKQIEIDQLYDLRAIRIIVDDETTCYTVISMVHKRWPHLEEEYDNYIENRKSNGYQSIHTVVFGPKGRHVEIQIRTHEMHKFAESGIASHWNYKEGGKNADDRINKVIDGLRHSLNALLERNRDDNSELLEDFHNEAFADKVFVMTPKGRVVELIKGATPLDFAYFIHTDIGHRCQGAKINGKITPLNYELVTGDNVEILTGKEARPKSNWLNPGLGYVKSQRTRQKINHWFRQQNHEKNLSDGHQILEREKHLLNLPHVSAADIYKQFNRQSERDFLIALGRGEIGHRQLANTLIHSSEDEIRFRKVPRQSAPSAAKENIEVYGVKNIYTQIASCCKPAYGDAIIGFTTQGRGVTVHRNSCANVNNLTDAQQMRLIPVNWSGDSTSYAVDIFITAYNDTGLLRDITQTLFKERINILSLHTQLTQNPDFVVMDLSIQINHTTQLSDVLERLMQIPAVTDAQRRGNQNER